MRLMDFIQQPDVLKFLFALLATVNVVLTIITTVVGVWAYRARQKANVAASEAQTAKTHAETVQLDAKSRNDQLEAIKTLATAMSNNADNERQERELRRQQIEQQNAAMMAIATNMQTFMQENASGRATAVTQVVNPLTAEIQANRKAIVEGFEGLESWLSAIADGIEDVRESVHRVIAMVQQPPAIVAVETTVVAPEPTPAI